jgi:pimeloyl-ACP methyl ester carboxylesterase/predicted amino acid-binding ACT domain protein
VRPATELADAPHSGAARVARRTPRRHREGDELITREVIVDGRRVSYAAGGRGVPVLFLHGWGLDHRVYQRSLRRLTARGCRVVAPSLPGFGSTAELPLRQRSLAGYAEWVDHFLEAIGASEPMLVLGHSFGGGIATKFAHEHTERVRYLIVVNAVGDPAVFGARRSAITSMRPTDLLRSGFEALRPPADDLPTTLLMQRALLENMSRHPFSVLHAAFLAQRADLTAEMAVLSSRELPVLVLWSDDDRLIPLAAFDTFCSTFGTDGHVVRGGHSWLLANPDVFGQVLDNVIQIQSAQRGTTATTANIAALRDLLAHTTLPRALVDRLLDGVSPLWVLSESPEVLSADLALCHPPLRPGEVRAVARQLPERNAYRLTVVAGDRPGLLADTAATLSMEGVSIDSASVITSADHRIALHALTVSSPFGFDEQRWSAIGERLRATAGGERPSYTFVPYGRARVTRTGEGVDQSLIRVTAPNRLGLLSAIARWFADQGISIHAADVATVDDAADDSFLVDGDCDTDALAAHLSGAGRSATPTPDVLLRALRCGWPRR